jgi:hypothetical protein
VDPKLREHADHLNYRYDRYTSLKDAITGAEGSLENFSKVRICVTYQ